MLDNTSIAFDEIKMNETLFELKIGNRENSPNQFPMLLEGTFHENYDRVIFSIQNPSHLATIEMEGVLTSKLENMMPVLRFVCQNCQPVRLAGEPYNNMFLVYKMYLSNSRKTSTAISINLFNEIVKRISKPAPEAVELGNKIEPFAMRTNDEFELFMEVCQNRLPAWVTYAYNRNKSAAKRFSLSSDERKHALRAQEMLLNIDWLPNVLEIPLGDSVRALLDEAFWGLDMVKERILEIVAQIRKTGTLPKWGILLNGPAGTGKTSIAKAVANILKMGIIQMDMSSLGEDPDEISGTSRTYANARPGMLLESMFQLRSSTAVLITNEVDKAGGKNRSTADILLSILDKTGFYENFLEEVIPTDNLLCIGTCNDLNKVSKPLRDRFLVINIPGYTPYEKKHIWHDYVFPRSMMKADISTDQLALTEDAEDLLVSEYAVEPGVRDLEQCAERFVGDYCRQAEVVSAAQKMYLYTVEDVKRLFGPRQHVVHNFAITPGLVSAAFYHDGCAYFFVLEASVTFSGTGKFEVLGPMTNIQKDYCKVAYYCICNTTIYDLSKCDVTVFVPQNIPEGAKNHVGLACYVAICSKILEVNLASSNICFIGGVDMNGSIFFDENTLTPLIRAMTGKGISTLYAPLGTNYLIDTKVIKDCKITIFEGANAETIFSLAVAHSGEAH